jgi:hypothetical protein
MWLLIVEALIALSLLVFFVWWTMFSGRRPDSRPPGGDEPADPALPPAPASSPTATPLPPAPLPGRGEGPAP